MMTGCGLKEQALAVYVHVLCRLLMRFCGGTSVSPVVLSWLNARSRLALSKAMGR